MKKGDKIIWDSGFGYDLCIFIEEKAESVFFIDRPIQLKYTTGICKGSEGLLPKREIIPYNEENIKLMNEKYGYVLKYHKRFA